MIAISWRHWNMWAESWSGWILATLFDTTVALVVVLGIWLLVRRHVSPRWCYLLFLLVPLKMLVPVELPWLPAPFAPTTRHVEAPAVARDEVAVPPRPKLE
jgi:beta-lactamase regulating signal transducer with metallopeptidase domain